jgi:hypothetical protein
MSQQSYSSTFRVGQYECTMTVDLPLQKGQAQTTRCEWDPCLPKALSAADLAQYKTGRHALMAIVAKTLGGMVLVVE